MKETGYERRRKVRIKGNGAAVYVGSFLTVHHPLFFVRKLLWNKLMQRFIGQ